MIHSFYEGNNKNDSLACSNRELDLVTHVPFSLTLIWFGKKEWIDLQSPMLLESVLTLVLLGKRWNKTSISSFSVMLLQSSLLDYICGLCGWQPGHMWSLLVVPIEYILSVPSQKKKKKNNARNWPRSRQISPNLEHYSSGSGQSGWGS